MTILQDLGFGYQGAFLHLPQDTSVTTFYLCCQEIVVKAAKYSSCNMDIALCVTLKSNLTMVCRVVILLHIQSFNRMKKKVTIQKIIHSLAEINQQ